MLASRLQVPSGRMFNFEDMQLLRAFADVGFIKYIEHPFRLHSGIYSNVYVYGRDDLTHNTHVLAMTGTRILRAAKEVIGEDLRRAHFLGLPTAGTAIATAAALADQGKPESRAGFSIIRENAKTTHGALENTGGYVVGKYDSKKWWYFILDNVSTDGGTKLKWMPRIRADGFPVLDVDWMVLVDRQQGAVKKLASVGIKKLTVIFNLLDITYAFREMGVWPTEAIAKVENEIKEHQLA